MIPLDARDLAILSVLQENGRISNRDLAARVDLSPSACLVRVRRLEKARVIRAYHARLDLSKVARSIQCLAMVKLAHHGRGAFRSFAAEARRLPEVVEVLMLSGQVDFMVKVVCSDIARYNVINDRLLDLGVEVDSISSYVVMEESKALAGIDLATLLDGTEGDR